MSEYIYVYMNKCGSAVIDKEKKGNICTCKKTGQTTYFNSVSGIPSIILNVLRRKLNHFNAS